MTDQDKRDRRSENARAARDYDTPKMPEATPPVISADRDTSGNESEGSGADQSNRARAARKLEQRQKDRSSREGSGEEELDSMTPETLFPPD